ncbi:MAG: hypothetical protein ACI4PO_09130 [Faecousia sp.]
MSRNSKNMQRLGTTLSNRMKQTSNAAATISVELGKVNVDMSITPDSLGYSVPKGDYMVNLLLTGEIYTSKETHTHSGGAHGGHEGGDGTHFHSGGEHKHFMPSAYRNLQPGDRVLIAWCGNDPVVIAIVVSS